jgi:hypothetical protein
MTYPIKHFLATLLIAPLISVFYVGQDSAPDIPETLGNIIETYPLFLIFGFAFALPVFILYYLFYKLLIKTSLPDIAIKLLLNTEAIAGLLITLKLIGGTFVPTAMIFYSIAVIISSLFFKVRAPEREQKDL